MSSRDRTELGRYVLHDEIASGGMATVHLGRMRGAVGFSKMVAIKRLHPQFAKDPDFVSMFMDEARLAARIRHPNVVPTLDVVADDGELFLVMEYIHGISLQRLAKLARARRERIPVDVTCGIAAGALHGLHAAHEAKSERGQSLDIVHRDVSPQNVMVGVDGLSRVLDFGVAKASWRIQTTRQGQVKGKVSYMAPEQVMGGTVGPWTDVHALGIVLWEVLTGERLFPVSEERGLLARFTQKVDVAPPSALNPDIPPELDAAVLQALAHDSAERQPSAQVMADQIEAAVAVATASKIGRFVQNLAEDELHQRATRIAEIEGGSVVSVITGALTPLLSKPETESDTMPAAPPVTDTATQAMPPSRPTGEDASKISMARSLAAGSISQAPRRRPWAMVAAGAAVTIAAGLLVLAVTRPEKTVALPSKDVALAASNERTATEPAIPAVPVSALPAAAEPESSAVVPEPQSSAVVDLAELPFEKEAKEARRAPKSVTRRKAATAPAPKTASKAGANCNPPYTVDSRGIRQLKMECVH